MRNFRYLGPVIHSVMCCELFQSACSEFLKLFYIEQVFGLQSNVTQQIELNSILVL